MDDTLNSEQRGFTGFDCLTLIMLLTWYHIYLLIQRNEQKRIEKQEKKRETKGEKSCRGWFLSQWYVIEDKIANWWLILLSQGIRGFKFNSDGLFETSDYI